MFFRSGRNVMLDSPHGEFKRSGENALVHLTNGATGVFKGIQKNRSALVDWDYIAIEIEVPLHWLKPVARNEQRKI